jgi:hypothetical protein
MGLEVQKAGEASLWVEEAAVRADTGDRTLVMMSTPANHDADLRDAVPLAATARLTYEESSSRRTLSCSMDRAENCRVDGEADRRATRCETSVMLAQFSGVAVPVPAATAPCNAARMQVSQRVPSARTRRLRTRGRAEHSYQ